jgi:hypothetical protein
MSQAAIEIVRGVSDAGLGAAARRLSDWLIADDATDAGTRPTLTSSRARALLRGSELVDEPTWNDTRGLLNTEKGARIALYDLLSDSALADEPAVSEVIIFDHAGVERQEEIDWALLAVAAFARQRGYPLANFDPGSPPESFSPAGQILARAAQFLRRQIQRSATDREKLVKQLEPYSAHPFEHLAGGSDLIAPLPPHFRSPVPVRYPEVARETLHVDPDSPEAEASAPSRGAPIVVTEDEIPDGEAGSPEDATRLPPIRIDREQLEPSSPPSPLPRSGVVMPSSSTESRPGLSVALRQMFRGEELKTTKLRVIVQQHPDGPGIYGLQVKIACKGIKAFVAGTTNRTGHFLAELPVRVTEGLTYDVDVQWPSELGGKIERKSITLNNDRTEFTLPFYHRLYAESSE